MDRQFFQACRHGKVEIVERFLNDEQDEQVDFNQRFENGWTAFSIACFFGQMKVVKLLVNDERIDINQGDDFGQTPLNIACNYGYIELVEILLASGKKVDFDAINNQGKTAIEIAMEEKNEEKRDWESKQDHRERKKCYGDVIELLESFEKNPNEIRIELRRQLGLAGKRKDFFFHFTFTSLINF